MVLIQFKLIILLLIGLIQISVAPSYCPVGQYGDKYDCTDCPAGRYNNIAHKKHEHDCKYCSKAKYAANKITSACSDCSPGLYNNDDKNTAHACKKCPQGKTSTSLSAPDCKKCADGQSTYDYVNDIEINICEPCPIGKRSNTATGNLCVDCTAGQYSDQPGMSSCKICGKGKFIKSNTGFAMECTEGRAIPKAGVAFSSIQISLDLTSNCRSDMCTDYGEDCCAPGQEARGCSGSEYSVFSGGTSSYA